MSDLERDAELARMPDVAGDDALEIDDGLLLRYRAGELDEEKTREVEKLLARSTKARALLAALAEPVSADRSAWMISKMQQATAPKPRNIARWAAPLGLALAASIAALIAVRGPSSDETRRYTLEPIRGAVQLERGATKATHRVMPQSELELWLRPSDAREPRESRESPPANTPEVALFVLDGDGRLVARTAEVTAKEGAIRVRARGATLFDDKPGSYVLLLVLATDRRKLDALPGRPRSDLGELTSFELLLEYKTALDPE